MAVDLSYADQFQNRHIGPDEREIREMLAFLGHASLDELIEATVPAAIRLPRPLALEPARSEFELLQELRAIASRNKLYRSFIGMGYSDTVTPPVLQRNILENPGWYTQYTPYQAEIAQGRLEALLAFQTMIIDLTGLPVANASLLDEGTAAAEAMMLLQRVSRKPGRAAFLISDACHPQTIDVVKMRARPIGVEVVVGDHEEFDFSGNVLGCLLQYPATDGAVHDYRALCERAHAAGAHVVVAADLLALTLLTPPGEFGADVAVGNTQRFGVPLGYGGPHAAFMAVRDDFKRQVPGRLIGVSVDRTGKPALRMALQTREQHIRRDKATSNICTAQVLLAVMAAMYAVYHGPDGLRRIATHVHHLTKLLARGLRRVGLTVVHDDFFDTVRVRLKGGSSDLDAVLKAADAHRVNLRLYADGTVGASLDQTTSIQELNALFTVFNGGIRPGFTADQLAAREEGGYEGALARTSPYLQHPVFNSYHSETEMMRYLHRLQAKDLSLTTSMIPLGSCTMKLNAAVELMPITWPEFNRMHPFAPPSQAEGYQIVIRQLESWLAEITGLAGVSLQPNSGAQGEYAGLLVIRAYHESRGEAHRNVCLIPSSAHGTNPASAVMAGMEVVVVACDEQGNVELDELREKAARHADRLAALMITYPSTHGVFEEDVREICEAVHRHGGLVYMDGANMNAQVGLTSPGTIGADVCHLNLHKTFCIPHGGGGPGVGPICVNEKLLPFLPGHPVVETGGPRAILPVSAAPFGSANILLISWAYIALMGGEGLTHATRVAILNANYMARRLEDHFPVLFRGRRGRCAHEFILDLRPFKKATGVTEEDVAKRLMDYGYHAPTMSFPVAGTIMIEPTESETRAELDRFCEALLSIRAEIREVADGQADPEQNVLKLAPHTAEVVLSDRWDRPYGREKAAFPLPWLREHKFWPSVSRIDNAYGDRNLVCACPPLEAYAV